MRLFFALWPPREAARALADWAGEVARESGGRATAEEKIHLTLAFLGEAKPEKAIAGARRVRGQAHRLAVELDAARPRQRIDPGSESEELAEVVIQVARENDLRTLALIGI